MMVYCFILWQSQEEVKKIIAGDNAFICNECVELAQGHSGGVGRGSLADVLKCQNFNRTPSIS